VFLTQQGHEIAAEGLRHEDVTNLARAMTRRARIDLTTKILSDITGRRPEGWFSLPRPGDPFAGGTISPNTMDLLVDAGYAYFGNGLADDIPHHWVTDAVSRRSILAMPYYYHYDDQWFPDVSRQRYRPGTRRLAVFATGGRSSTRSIAAAGTFI